MRIAKSKSSPRREVNAHPQEIRRRAFRVKDIYEFTVRLFCNPKYFWYLATIYLLGEFVLNALIIQKVKYTEIDWNAYMQEVEGFLNGERDYTKLKGDTGPLVYPAGFTYIYSLLYYVTNKGSNIRLAQYIFDALYLISQFIVCAIYSQSERIPPYIILLLGCSKRFHSIFLLRCFNDPIAMIFMYGCILAMTYRRWTLSTILYSLALSVKMNVLLFFPAFGIILWQVMGAYKTVLGQIGLMILIQVGLGLPFLRAYPKEYIGKAFEFGRVFDYEWTVNWRMMTEERFLSTEFAQWLIIGHVFTLFMFIVFIWTEPKGGLIQVFKRGFLMARNSRNSNRAISSISTDDIITMMFTSNFIGIIFARSLHYQFYSWYFQSIPYLLWQAKWEITKKTNIFTQLTCRILLFATIEACWLTFPSTVQSSWTLAVCHLMLLLGIYGNSPAGP